MYKIRILNRKHCAKRIRRAKAVFLEESMRFIELLFKQTHNVPFMRNLTMKQIISMLKHKNSRTVSSGTMKIVFFLSEMFRLILLFSIGNIIIIYGYLFRDSFKGALTFC